MSTLALVRKQLMTSGLSEAEVLSDSEGIRNLFDQIQKLKREMNEAKKKAADEAAQPYLETIEIIEKRYALLIKLSSR